MKRGEVWTVAGGDYTAKHRPAVIVQNNTFASTASITICPLTTNRTDADLFRLPIEPNTENGLREASRLMVDKISSVPKTRLGRHLGQLSNEEMARLGRAIVVFLGLAGADRR